LVGKEVYLPQVGQVEVTDTMESAALLALEVVADILLLNLEER
jgi:hypothetical protein